MMKRVFQSENLNHHSINKYKLCSNHQCKNNMSLMSPLQKDKKSKMLLDSSHSKVSQ